MTIETILLVITLGLNLFIGLYVLYLKKYFEKKGKNLADKEDLGELTTIVEEVKSKFQEENEILKTNLGIIANKRNLIFSEQKQCIIDFSTELNIWIWDALKINVFEYGHNNHSDLGDKLIKLRDQYNKVQIAFSKIQLLVDSPDLVTKAHESVTETLKLHGFVDLKVSALKRNLSWERMLVEQITSKDFDFRKAPQPMAEFYKSEAHENKTEREKLLKDYRNEYGEIFNVAIGKRNEFIGLAKQYLNV
jgi:hypothetical protein